MLRELTCHTKGRKGQIFASSAAVSVAMIQAILILWISNRNKILLKNKRIKIVQMTVKKVMRVSTA